MQICRCYFKKSGITQLLCFWVVLLLQLAEEQVANQISPNRSCHPLSSCSEAFYEAGGGLGQSALRVLLSFSAQPFNSNSCFFFFFFKLKGEK